MKGFRWASLRTRIIAWFFIPTAIILVAVALVTFYAYQQVTEELVIERDQDLTRLSASQFAVDLGEYTDILSTLARSVGLHPGDLRAQRDLLKASSNRVAAFDGGVMIFNTFGVVIAVEPEASEVLGQDRSDRPYYHEMVRSHIAGAPRPVISEIQPDGPEGVDVVALAVPILGDQNEFLGMIVGMFRIGETTSSALYTDINELRLEGTGNMYVIDGEGSVIYHSDSSLIGNDFTSRKEMEIFAGGGVGAIRLLDAQGHDIVASFAPIPETSWSLVNEELWETLTEASRGYQQSLLFLQVMGVVIPALVVAVGIRRVMRPIEDLIGAAQEVAKGNFGQSITTSSDDEIGELAEQFNLMSDQLEESYRALEQRVADRTMELATLNAIAAVVSRSMELKDALKDALEKTLEAVDIEAGGIYLLKEDSGVLRMAISSGFSPEFVKEVDNLKVGEGFSGWVVQSGEPLVVDDISTDPRLTRMAAKEEGFHSVASFPLVSKRKVFGALFVITRGFREFSQQDIDLLTSIGQQIGVAIENARLFKAEQRRAEQFRVISEVGRRIASLLGVDDILNQMVRLIQEALDYDTVEIGLVESDELIFKARAEPSLDGPFESYRMKIGEESITGWVAAAGEPQLVNDIRQDPRYVSLTSGEFLSELAVPIKVKDKVIGVLNAQSYELDAFDHSDLAVMQSLADQAAIAIENARLFHAEQWRAEQFRVVSEVGRHITSILDVDELLKEIVRSLKETFGYYLITIGMIEGDEVVFRAGVKTHWDDPHFRPPSVKVGAQGITAWVAGTGEPLLAPDVSQEPRFLFLEDAAETRSELAVPLKVKDEVIGVLNVESDQLNAFDESDMRLLQSLAHQAAIAIENARLYEQARELAVVEERNRLARDLHDAVTQTLFSASIIAEVLPRLWERNLQEGERRLDELRQLTRGALAEMRTLLIELRPAALVDAELGELLYQLADAGWGRTQVEIDVDIRGEREIPEGVKVVLYRIAQEALNNVAKHAGAKKIAVSLYFEPDRVELSVQDDGRGFNPANVSPDRLGLGIMGERVESIGASLNIDTEPGQGTKVKVIWFESEGRGHD
jgi:nitrate/nitrite-specific signal transduction histidine kinase